VISESSSSHLPPNVEAKKRSYPIEFATSLQLLRSALANFYTTMDAVKGLDDRRAPGKGHPANETPP
jgi:hypothetical protein